MDTGRGRLAAAAGVWAFLLAAPDARGYDVAIHSLLDERAIPAEVAERRPVAFTMGDVQALRVSIYRAGAAHSEPAVRERFLRRYPTEAAFDAWAFKEFLALDPAADVFGIDRLPEPGTVPSVRALLALGSRQPDDDRRNQSRFAYDAERRVRRDPYGQPVPADPAQLAMGALTGNSSQAHAHYGLPRLVFSDSADVLKTEPRRFAYPPTARAFAAEFVQLHTDLAICAATLDREGGPALGWLLLGQSHHYLQDVANQIHTLQAIYPFFRDAKIGEIVADVTSLGGVLGARPDFVTIGIAIIENHHLLAEALFAKRVSESLAGRPVHPAVVDALAGIGRGDPTLERALDERAQGAGDAFGQAITDVVIEASSHEGAEVYELIRALARPELSRWSHAHAAAGADPDPLLRDPPDPRVLERFYRLQAAGFARAGSALRRHVGLYLAAVAPAAPAARRERFLISARRLVTTQVDYLDARDQRLAAYRPKPPRSQRVNAWIPGGALIALALAGFGMMRLARRRPRRAPA